MVTVRFVIGGPGSGKTEYVMRMIEKTLEETDRKIILLVPEQQTVVCETALAERFDPSAALRLEAMSFTRLANSVARVVGGLSGRAVSRGAKTLLTWRAVASVGGYLSSLAPDVRGARGYLVPRIAAQREEMKVNSVTPERMEKALEAAREAGKENEPAFSKLRDLSLIFSAYESIVSEEFGEEYREAPGQETVALGAKRGFFDNTTVFIDSFFSMTKEELQTVEELIRVCDVTVTVAMGDERAPLADEEPVKRYFDVLASVAARFCDAEYVRLGKRSRRASTAELSAVAEKLFDYGAGKTAADEEDGAPSVPESVRVFSVKDRYEEAEAAASVIEETVRRGGRYSDVAVIAGDLDSLSGVVESCFARHGIPCFRADPTTLDSSPLARHFLSLLKIPGSWRREDIIRLVKTGLTSLTEEEAFAFETYTGVWNVRGRRMFNSVWSMNPSGYKADFGAEDKAMLFAANGAREKLIPAIEEFSSVFDGGEADVEEVCRALMKYAEQSGLYTALLSRADRLAAANDRDGAVRETETFSKFCDCFDEIVKYLPGVKCDAEGFSAILRFAMTDVSAGSIPTGVDEVALGSAATVRTGAVRHVILLGCVSGEFPGAYKGSDLFSEDEKEELSEAGVDMGAGGREQAAMELLRFRRSASLPSESLTLFVPSTSFGTKCEPSSGAGRVLAITGEKKPTPFSSLPLGKRLFSAAGIDAAISAAEERGDDEESAALREERDRIFGSLPYDGSETAKVSEATARSVFGGDLDFSQSGINTFVNCPFSYYTGYVLKIGEYERASITSLDRGTFVHFILERFFTLTAGEEYPLEKERTEEVCDSVIRDYLSRMFGGAEESERVRYIFIGLRRTALLFIGAVMNEMAQSRFKIFKNEMKFGEKDADGPGPYAIDLGDGTKLTFNGKIDRLDVFTSGRKAYVRVVDYKTSEKKFDLEAVRRGIDMQLLIYLFSVWRTKNKEFVDRLGGGQIVPAGAVYLSFNSNRKTVDGFLEAEEGEKKALEGVSRNGLFLNDPESLEAMDRGLTGVYVPAGLNDDGTSGPAGCLSSLEEIGRLCASLEATAAKIVSEMRSGDGAARREEGDRSPCKRCKGKAVCRRAAPVKRR